jgi:hypothetical protein
LPFERLSDLGWFRIDLAVVEDEVGTYQLLDSVKHPPGNRKFAKPRIVRAGFINAANSRSFRFLTRLHFEPCFVVVCRGASLANRFNLAYEFSNLFGTQEVWTDSPAVVLVLSADRRASRSSDPL